VEGLLVDHLHPLVVERSCLPNKQSLFTLNVLLSGSSTSFAASWTKAFFKLCFIGPDLSWHKENLKAANLFILNINNI
jgi:hypothetical protein